MQRHHRAGRWAQGHPSPPRTSTPCTHARAHARTHARARARIYTGVRGQYWGTVRCSYIYLPVRRSSTHSMLTGAWTRQRLSTHQRARTFLLGNCTARLPWMDNTPRPNCLFTPELQWQSRGKRRILQGCPRETLGVETYARMAGRQVKTSPTELLPRRRVWY